MLLDTTVLTLAFLYLAATIGSVVYLTYHWHKKRKANEKHANGKPKLKLIRGNRGIK